MSSSHPFGDVIYSYTRKQAIDDGVLVDLTEISEAIRQVWKHHLACTDTVWTIIESATAQPGQDLEGILHDIAFMAMVKARTQSDRSDTVRFQVIIAGTTHSLKLHVGPGDTAEPVLTLMLPTED
jgi:hypothetical protein